MAWPLSENHRRGISSTLVLLDEMLCRFERWAEGEAFTGVLYREHNTLSAKHRRRILKEIAALRNLQAEPRDLSSLSDADAQPEGPPPAGIDFSRGS